MSTEEVAAVPAPAIESAPLAKEEKIKKAKAPSKPRASLAHPPYVEMISDAITSLKERTGSSQYAITKFISDKYSSKLSPTFKKILLLQLKKLTADGKLTKVKASYKIPPAARIKKPAAKPKAKTGAKSKSKTAAKPKAKTATKAKKPAAKLKKAAVAKTKKVASKPKAKAPAAKVAKKSAKGTPSKKKVAPVKKAAPAKKPAVRKSPAKKAAPVKKVTAKK